jgi:hypothetical protein
VVATLRLARKTVQYSLLITTMFHIQHDLFLLGDFNNNNFNQFDDVALHGNAGDTSWQAEIGFDQGFKRQNKIRSTKPQDFQVCFALFFFHRLFFM